MTDPDTTIDWSYSNSQLYASCPRSLFFHYWQRTGTAEASNSGGDAIVLGSTESGGAIIGSAIHKALEEHIRRWAQNKRTGMQQTQSVANSYIREAVSQGQGSQSLDSSTLSETTDVHLKRFFKTVWPTIRSQRYILHEKTDSFTVDGTKAWIRPDLCVREFNNDNKFVIYDWKSRQPSTFEDTSLQLSVYALWAHKKYEPDIERISTRLVFTGNGHIERQSVSIQDLEQLETRITSEAAEWNPPNRKSSFLPKEDPKKCKKCPYLSSCTDGQQELRSL